MKTKYLKTKTHSIADIGKAGSSALSYAILTQLHPDRILKWGGKNPTNTANHIGRKNIPREDNPSLPLLMAVRNPIERFRSACGQMGIKDVDSALGILESGDKMNPHHKLRMIDLFVFIPQSSYLPTDMKVELYKFPEGIDDLAERAGLTTPLDVINDSSTNGQIKPDLTPEQEARVASIYSADIELFNSLTKPS